MNTIDLEISSPGAAPDAANMKPIESVAFSRGRQSHSDCYNGSMMTFFGHRRRHARAIRIDRSGQQKRQCAASTYYHREDDTFYVVEGEVVISVGNRTIKATAYRAMWPTRSQSNRSSVGCSFCSLPPGLKHGSRNSVCRHPMTLPPADEPAYGEVERMLEAASRYGIEFVSP